MKFDFSFVESWSVIEDSGLLGGDYASLGKCSLRAKDERLGFLNTEVSTFPRNVESRVRNVALHSRRLDSSIT